MEALIERLKKAKKRFFSRKGNIWVKKYYKTKRDPSIQFERNIWKSNKYWDYFYQSFPASEKSDLYVPMDYYNYKVLPNLNDPMTRIYLQDKNMFDRVYGNSGVKLPTTFFRCINGVFLDVNYEIVSDVDKFVSEINEDFIVKQTRQSGGGKGVEKYAYKEGKHISLSTGKEFDVNDTQRLTRGDFIVQQIVHQHDSLGKFHPNSVNTVKIMTYRSVETNKVHILLAEMRIGIGATYVDNTGQGGMAVGIDIHEDKQAFLRKYGFVEVDDFYEEHPDTKIAFENSQIHHFDKIIDAAIKLADRVPHNRLIGWDFSVNTDGEAVLIESNSGSGIDILQLVNGKPIFGAFSHEVKKYLDTK